MASPVRPRHDSVHLDGDKGAGPKAPAGFLHSGRCGIGLCPSTILYALGLYPLHECGESHGLSHKWSRTCRVATYSHQLSQPRRRGLGCGWRPLNRRGGPTSFQHMRRSCLWPHGPAAALCCLLWSAADGITKPARKRLLRMASNGYG